MPDRVLRFGVLGAARITPAALLKPARSHPEVRVDLVAARDPSRAAAYASKHRIPRVADGYEAVVTDPDVDAVYIPLPNSLHAEWTLAALEAGKHVLCEKPFTSNTAEADRVAAAAELAAERHGLVVMEAFHYRYHPLAQRMQQIVESGELGAIRHIEAWLCAPIPNKSDIRYQAELSGGAMMDMGSYVVHWARLLGGEEPTVVSATAKLQTPRSTGPWRPSWPSREAIPARSTVPCGPGQSSIWPPASPVTGGSCGWSIPSPPRPSAG